ncbi:MAG: molybdopterin biosynthesis protein [Candidatus Hodarchaeales archaeon]|jgi:putative molybdopterin biosynthesis protein
MNSVKKREFLDLISIEEAKLIIQENFKWTPTTEILSLQNSKNRILAEDIIASMDIPPFDRSRMDGYAVNSEDTYSIDENNPATFRVIESIQAGDVSKKTLKEPYTCIEIATGALIPRGTNAVVMIEYTSKVSESNIEIFRPVTPQENIDSAGTDIMFGETVLRSGQSITSIRTGILAALGINEVSVLSKLVVGVLSSGNELRKPGQTLPMGCIYDSNSIILVNLLSDLGVDVKDLGICPDDLEELKTIIEDNLPNIDILLISGGTSAGEGDYSYRVITELGGNLLFHGVSSQPGKPLAAGIIRSKLIVTLPGFPASAIFSFNTVISPLIREWITNPVEDAIKIKALVSQKIRNNSGRTQFKLVHLLKDKKIYRVVPVKGTSGSVSALERADGFITIPENISILNPGEIVEISLFQKKLFLSDLVFVGSHDFVIDRLFREFKRKHPEFNTKLIFSGSSGGLSSLSREECDIAGCHLLDDEKNEYNLPFIKKIQITDKIEVIKGYNRMQGLYVPKGNPKQIKSINDLLRPDIVFMNRIEGSGTRILLDSLLKNLADQKKTSFEKIQKQINGYFTVASSHSATVNAVARGIIDVSIGIKSFAQLIDIDFIPLTEERYDLLISKKSKEKPSVKILLSIFSSEEFRKTIQNEVGETKWLS